MKATLPPPVALLFATVATLSSPLLAAQAQTYPTKPVRMVVGFPPGGAVDIVARIIGKRLGENLNTPIVVDNRPGAGSAIGAEVTAKAPPDGYTLFLTAGSIAINVGLQKHLPYDPVKDFAAISLIASTPNVLVVQPSLPVTTVADLIKLARTKPGQLNYGSGGSGTMTHLSGELLKVMTGIQITHVAYKGAPLAVVDVMAGQIQMAIGALPGALPQIKASQVRAIAVTTTKRSPSAPDIPTVAESGVPDTKRATGRNARAGRDARSDRDPPQRRDRTRPPGGRNRRIIAAPRTRAGPEYAGRICALHEIGNREMV